MLKIIDGSLLKDMFLSGSALLVKNKSFVDSLNVFPVPDGDTGTNMCHTIQSAIKELNGHEYVSVSDVAEAVARGALRGARGNSGVILSQILRGFAKALSGLDEMNAETLVKMLRSGADTAYKAVMKPKEGTILTVQRVIAEDIEKMPNKPEDITELFSNVINYGNEILKKTPDLLPVLKQAGVVDSGGQGLMLVYTGFLKALMGEPVTDEDDGTGADNTVLAAEWVDDHDALEEITFGYCTEFIVSHPKEGMKDSDVVRLRKRLERIGDCVLVISDLSVVKVHVHTNDPGKAIQMALELGELDSIKIDNMLEEHRERMARKAEKEKAERKEFGIVAVSLGEGFSSIFKELGVDVIVEGGQTMNPSIEDLAKAIEQANSKKVFVLPNNSNIILAAQQATALTECEVYVIPTKSVPMGISAAIVFDPDSDAETINATMIEAAENVHTASVTYAVRDTNFDGRDIHMGDIMGLVDNKIAKLGDDVDAVALDVALSMITDETGMVTVYYGSDTTEEQAQALAAKISAQCDDMCEVEVQNGGQPLYYYLISVE